MTSEAFQRVTDETLQQSHLKFGTTGEAQSFRIQKNEKHRIVENNRISFQKKTQRSSFKITTCERFQILNNDALQELSSMSSQATAWHHVTGRTPEFLLVKLKYYIEPSVKDTQITNFTADPSIKLIVSFYAVA